ncbi:MAG: hypothetical protein KBD01_01720 [Acidobacteria bacterium]|nr:hypothetical protein [Acidobacteriota bacterium]
MPAEVPAWSLWLVAPAALALFFLARWLWIRRLDRRLDRSVEDAGIEVRDLGAFPGVAAGEIAALGAYSVYEAIKTLVMVDDRVVAAADFSGGLKDGFRSIHAQLASEAQGDLVSFYADKAAAAHLAAEGHVVEAAQGVPGAEFLVDGHPVRVEIGLDPGLVKQHLAQFPGVDVIVNHELGAQLHDVPGVLVDPALSHADAAEHVQRTLERVGELDKFNLNFPFITFSLALLAYTPLVFRRQLTLREGAKYTAIDTGLVGVPAMTLGKVGALAGLGLGPVGSAVGGLLGAVAGGVAGAAGAGWAKARAYRGQVSAYHEELRAIGAELPEALADKKRAAERKRAMVEKRFPLSSALRAWLWPTLNDRIVPRLAADFDVLFERIAEQAGRARDLMAGIGVPDPSPELCAEAAGAYALDLVRGGELWTPRLVRRLRRLAAAADGANEQQAKLRAAREAKQRVFSRLTAPLRRLARWLRGRGDRHA